MKEEERLQVQNSTSLSIALISFSAALIGGAVAGFLAIADKIPSDAKAILLSGVVVLSILALTSSIMFGGWGISATNRALRASTTALPANYDSGYFSWQVLSGAIGLLFGAIGFILLAAFAMTHKEAAKADAAEANIRALQASVDRAGSQIDKAGTELRAENSLLQGIFAAAQTNEKLLSEILSRTKPPPPPPVVTRPRSTLPSAGHR